MPKVAFADVRRPSLKFDKPPAFIDGNYLAWQSNQDKTDIRAQRTRRDNGAGRAMQDRNGR